jgi:outer membrane protein OmpA-like peptidoglycan-associated protein
MNKKMYLGLLLSLALGACATTPQSNEALDNARTAVKTAEADPNVAKYAPLDLEAAQKELAIAESAFLHNKQADVSQPAYLATQNARLAQAHASAKANDAQVAASQAERDKIVLAARTQETDKAKAESARLQAEVDALKATATARGLVMTLGDVLFDTGKADLNSGGVRKMDQLAQFLTEHPQRRVQIDGFTDSVGSDSFNLQLSQRRADAVRAALMTRGVDASRISTEGYGKAYPVASNSDSGGRQLNRRVEVVIGGENGSAIAPRS